ncbi:MAG: redox-sensing transcriptional repressor Rex [Endomicrobia bacterium]|nr:redox-sensing transcriptional repressor Rex [Endomicrobiia bacterium]MCX7941052.1 redox-sensing transcriptional repressor Rex [Endomicrobiia bacterium]MDW8056376.1 redox-sensing transcriptional repressor Rex [Elusimicrobiota bacterium]
MNKDMLNRLIQYKNVAMRMKELGFVRVFSVNLADALNINPVKVRKDFSQFHIKGKNKGGYDVDYLITKIDEILGKEGVEKVVVVGVGNIGSALINYPGFENVGIKIVAGFDIDPAKIKQDREPPILHLDKMKDFVQQENVKIGILAVPEVAAQRVAELMVSYGIRGILNFSPAKLKIKNCIVTDVHIEAELENLVYFVKNQEKISTTKEKQKDDNTY